MRNIVPVSVKWQKRSGYNDDSFFIVSVAFSIIRGKDVYSREAFATIIYPHPKSGIIENARILTITLPTTPKVWTIDPDPIIKKKRIETPKIKSIIPTVGDGFSIVKSLLPQSGHWGGLEY